MADKKTFLAKDELAAQLVEKVKMTKGDATKAVEVVFSAIAEGLLASKKDGVRIPGFGTFEVVVRKERTGVNPSDSNKKITIPATKAVKFKPSKTLKELVKNS